MCVMPVMLPPGCAKVLTNLPSTGSPLKPNTIGMVALGTDDGISRGAALGHDDLRIPLHELDREWSRRSAVSLAEFASMTRLLPST